MIEHGKKHKARNRTDGEEILVIKLNTNSTIPPFIESQPEKCPLLQTPFLQLGIKTGARTAVFGTLVSFPQPPPTFFKQKQSAPTHALNSRFENFPPFVPPRLLRNKPHPVHGRFAFTTHHRHLFFPHLLSASNSTSAATDTIYNPMTIGFKSWVFKCWNLSGGGGRRMRIADVLMDSDDDFSGEIVVGSDKRSRRRRGDEPQCVGCLTPRFVLSRWFSSARKTKGRKNGEAKVGENRFGKCFPGRWAVARSRLMPPGVRRIQGTANPRLAFQRYRKEDCFNIAIGFGLFYAIAASKKELDKMIQLRTEVETLLQNVREALQNQPRETPSKLSKPNEIAFSPIGAQESLSSNCPLLVQELFNNPADSELSDRSVTCNKTRPDNPIDGINHIESELEVELERLQTYLDTRDAYECPKQQVDEVIVEDTAPGDSFEEVSKLRDENTIQHFGVPPDLLAMKLHELLESRQRERIEELEAALECANHNLYEKERELRWWKDTAHVISRRVPKNSLSIM